MLWSDVIPQEAKDLGAMGSQALLGVAVMSLVAALVFIFKTWRSDVDKSIQRMDELQKKHEVAMKEQREMQTAAIERVVEAVKVMAEESRVHAQECRANFQTVFGEMSRRERQ